MITHLGCDPEVFLVDAAGKFISSVGLIGGTKDAPMPIDVEGNAVQEDNVAVEFNTPPCSSKEMFIENIRKNKTWLEEKAASLGLSVSINPSAVFDPEQLQTEAAQTFGCEPDYNAWKGGAVNPRPFASDPNLRSCGGHIHVELPDFADKCLVVQWMDLYVGCLMLEFDDDKARRSLYGKAGACRFKPYGVEYRTASNRWIEDDEKIAWVWDQTDKAVEKAMQGIQFTEEQAKKIQQCINKSDLGLLAELKAEFGL
jgi:hypothetical protein